MYIGNFKNFIKIILKTYRGLRMKLDRDLAQKIVKNTMSVLGKNINIMNHKGIIIGSGDRSRLNTFHEIANKVIENQQPFIIKEEEIDKFQGVKEGINLPIRFQENIIGVVGITGEVKEVTGYGEIVKNMVELILQQEFLRQEIEMETRARENFYQQLLGNSIEAKDLLQDRIKLFKINSNLDRVVFLIKLETFNNKLVTNEMKELNDLHYLNDEDIFLMRGDNLVLVKTLETKEMKLQSKQILKLARILEKHINKKISSPMIGIGQIVNNLDRLYLSYKGAKFAFAVGNKVYKSKNKQIFYINHLGYDYILPFIDYSHSDYFLHNLFDKDIEGIFSETDTGEIIELLVENDLNVSKTAEQLYIHRNTLLYRINKIKKRTGLNPKKAKDLFTLLLAYHLYLFNK